MKYARMSGSRRLKQSAFTAFCYFSSALSLFVLSAILWSLIRRGLPALHWNLFTVATPAPGAEGGLSNAILGSVIITGLGILIAAPIGVLIATYLVEFGSKTRLSGYVRFVNDVLLSGPSIIAGLFVYAILVKPLGHFSGLAGAVSLAIIALPMVVRTTEDVLYLVSPMLKEAAIALGIPRWRVTLVIIYRSAKSGIITAILLAIARVAGETAPLLFTALNDQFSNTNLLQPMANLPVVIFQFAMSPYESWQNLAWAGALLTTVIILVINLLARIMLKERGTNG